MSPANVRRNLKLRIDKLPSDRLRIAEEFVAFLEEREATEELLAIPGFMRDLEEAKRNIAEGRVTPVEHLKRKDRRVQRRAG